MGESGARPCKARWRCSSRTTLAAAHRQSGKGILEHLLECEELEGAKRDGWVKAEPALVRPDGAVHLDAVAAVDLHLAVAVGPGDAEHDDPFRLGHALKNLGLLVFGVLLDERPNRLSDLGYRLVKLRFGGIPLLECGQKTG